MNIWVLILLLVILRNLLTVRENFNSELKIMHEETTFSLESINEKIKNIFKKLDKIEQPSTELNNGVNKIISDTKKLNCELTGNDC